MAFELPQNVLQVFNAIGEENASEVKRLLGIYPELKSYSDASTESFLHEAVNSGSKEMVQMLLDLGLDINKTTNKGGRTPLVQAIYRDNVGLVRYLLSRGADPNIDRPLISAINCDDPEVGFEIVKLLVEHGVDVNRSFPWFDDPRLPEVTALSWAEDNEKHQIAEYLRKHGAVSAVQGSAPVATEPSDQIIDHLARQFGPVRKLALREIVPAGTPVSIHVIDPTNNRSQLTLFTTGLSSRPMKTPKGQEDFQFAELVIHLPPKWPLTAEALKDPDTSWPLRWLKNVAQYPHQNATWLGGPVTVIANVDPPKPLSPGNPFVAMLLFAEDEVSLGDGKTVKLYTMTPLYREEYELERREGVPALFRAFDRHDIKHTVDTSRKNVAL